MAMNSTQLADEIAAALGYSPTSQQLIAFATGTVEEVRLGVATFGGVPSPHSISGLDPSRMAALIQSLAPYPTISTQLIGYCNGVTTHVMTSGIVTYSGPPLPPGDDWYQGGTISGLDGSVLADLVKNFAGYPYVTAKLLAECTAVVDHIMNNAEVESGVIS